MTSITTLVQLRPRSYGLPGSMAPSESTTVPLFTGAEEDDSASSQTSVLAPISNCGHKIVILEWTLPGVTRGVARVTRTGWKRGWLRGRMKFVGMLGGRLR